MIESMPVVDAHHHFWDIPGNYHPWLCDDPMIPFRYGDYTALRKPFMPRDYESASRKFTVIKSVTVEAEWNPQDPLGETRWIHRVADEFGRPHAHVAQAWLDSRNAEEILAGQAEFPLVRGIRHKPAGSERPLPGTTAEPGGLSDPAFQRGYSLLARYGLSFDLQTPWWHLPEALKLGEKFPETLIILNHTGLPSDRSPEGLSAWRSAMKTFAQFPNAMVKISGLGLPGKPWLLEDNRGIILDTLEIFGLERCMFASNFPVDSLVGDFDTIFSGFLEAVRDLDPGEKRKLFVENALRIYRIDAQSSGRGTETAAVR